MQYTAPHEGQELKKVLDGTKPLGLVEQMKDPVQYREVINTLGLSKTVRPSNDGCEVVFTLPENSVLITQCTLLLSPAAVIVRSKEEHQRLMGRLFGYSDIEINAFIEGDIKCNCTKCVGVSGGN